MAAVAPALHSVDSSAWYTPASYVEPARDLMGGIDLDPASDASANGIVQATSFYSFPDGLMSPWSGRLFVNPPSPPEAWWVRLSKAFAAGDVTAAVYIAYSLEQIQQSQLWAKAHSCHSMLHYRVCVPKRRIPFLRTAADAIVSTQKLLAKITGNTTKDVKRRAQLQTKLDGLLLARPEDIVEGDSPAHANAVVGLGVSRAAFVRAFGHLGDCL